MIRYIDLYRDQFGVEAICRVLRATERGFITSRGYRAAKSRPASHRQVRDAVLISILKYIHQPNYGVYGVLKMWHSMTLAGRMIGRDQLARLMRKIGRRDVVRGVKTR